MSTTEERAIEAVQKQAAKGLQKYPTGLESGGHSLTELLEHKQQEIADELMYTTEAIERAKALEAENIVLKEWCAEGMRALDSAAALLSLAGQNESADRFKSIPHRFYKWLFEGEGGPL